MLHPLPRPALQTLAEVLVADGKLATLDLLSRAQIDILEAVRPIMWRSVTIPRSYPWLDRAAGLSRVRGYVKSLTVHSTEWRGQESWDALSLFPNLQELSIKTHNGDQLLLPSPSTTFPNLTKLKLSCTPELWACDPTQPISPWPVEIPIADPSISFPKVEYLELSGSSRVINGYHRQLSVPLDQEGQARRSFDRVKEAMLNVDVGLTQLPEDVMTTLAPNASALHFKLVTGPKSKMYMEAGATVAVKMPSLSFLTNLQHLKVECHQIYPGYGMASTFPRLLLSIQDPRSNYAYETVDPNNFRKLAMAMACDSPLLSKVEVAWPEKVRLGREGEGTLEMRRITMEKVPGEEELVW